MVWDGPPGVPLGELPVLAALVSYLLSNWARFAAISVGSYS